jgi:ABC-2 type transport system ATP-binding protein
MPAIEYDGLVKRFGATTALAGVGFTCPPASVTALIGPNGAGKSTLFLATAGLLVPDAGTVSVGGHPAGTPGAQRAVSFMPEQPDLYPGVSVWEHVTFVALLYRLEDWRPQAERLLARFGLTDRLDALPHELSQGLRRRLALVMALLRGADVLLLDEPFNGLDPRSARELRDHVGELASAGACVLVATHVLSDVERLCDRAIVLDRGRTTAQGTLDELRRHAGMGPGAELEAAYLALTEAAGA